MIVYRFPFRAAVHGLAYVRLTTSESVNLRPSLPSLSSVEKRRLLWPCVLL
jgi:hypothetical protein